MILETDDRVCNIPWVVEHASDLGISLELCTRSREGVEEVPSESPSAMDQAEGQEQNEGDR